MKNDKGFSKIKSILKIRKGDYIFKTLASSVISFSLTVMFAFYNGYLGISLLSAWHGGICVFYLLLVLIRGIILLTERRNRFREDEQKSECRKRTFAVTAPILLLLNLALILPISWMVVLKRPVNMGLIPAIAMAAYTTYKLAMASVHIKKLKRSNHDNILIAELRTINFIDAWVSILTLQNTLIMVNQGKSDSGNMLVVTAVSSAVIYAVIIFVTVLFIVNGARRRPPGAYRA